MPLIGFAGAPFTLASYMIEGGSTQGLHQVQDAHVGGPRGVGRADARDHRHRRRVPEGAGRGGRPGRAGLRQLGRLPRAVATTSAPSCRTRSALIAEVVRQAGVPVINFSNNTSGMLDLVQQAGGDVIGLDWRIEIGKAIGELGRRTSRSRAISIR